MNQRASTFKFANALANDVIHSQEPGFDRLSAQFKNQIDQLFSNSNDVNGCIVAIIKCIKCVQQHQDSEIGIISQYKTDYSNPESLPVYFRDARKLKDIPPKNQYHPFLTMGLQALLAVRKLAALEGVDDIDERFRLNDAKLFYSQISQNTEQDKPEYELARYIEQYILPELADALSISKDEALKRLQVAKDFCNLEFETQAVATLTVHVNAQNKLEHILQVDAPVVNLTQDLKNEYRTRAQQPWFQGLHVWQQKLVDAYADRVVQGGVIPTQLRKYFPGLRNAAEERVFVLNEQQEENFEIYHVYHSGNLGHLTKGDNEKLTGFAIDQLKQEIGSSHLQLASLTSPLKGTKLGQESILDGQVESASHIRQHKLTRGVVPINPIRHFIPDKTSTDWMIHDAYDLLKAALDKKVTISHLSENEFWAMDLSNIIGLLDNKYKSDFYFIELIRVARSLKKVKNGSDRESDGNRHVKLARNMLLLAFYHEKCCEKLNLNDKKFAVNFFCKSGKDRTGFLDLVAITYAVAKYLAKDAADPEWYRLAVDAAADVMTRSLHIQRRAGDVGATLGAQGFVPSLDFALSDRFKEKALKDLILLKAARYNKKFPEMSSISLGNDQQNRIYYECSLAIEQLRASSTSDQPSDLTLLGLKLADKAQNALKAGVSVFDVPVLTNLLHSAKSLVENDDPASVSYLADLRRFTRSSKEVIGSVSIGKIIGGVAIALLGVAMIAAAFALGIPSGGLSIAGVVIGAEILATGVALASGSCLLAGTIFAIHGRKKGMAKHSEEFLEVAEQQRLAVQP